MCGSKGRVHKKKTAKNDPARDCDTSAGERKKKTNRCEL